MEKKELANILSELLLPMGFKKKGYYWVINGDVITKMINLQKSNHSNAFYINYGYILNSIPLGNLTMHIYNRVSSIDIEEGKRINFLLDLSSSVSDIEREEELKEIIHNKLVKKIQAVNTEVDILDELKKRSHLNDVPLIVKEHFNLPNALYMP
jgi:hypothetical protein